MSNIITNFSAGPSALPKVVRAGIAEALSLDRQGQPSVIELSHRGPQFGLIAEELEHRLHQLLGTKQTHQLLFLQGGASLQFAQFPLNFCGHKPPAFLVTGHWGEKAFAEAKRIGPAKLALSAKASGYTEAPSDMEALTDCAYLHFTGNETIHGVQYATPPRPSPSLPIVGDLSSEFLSKPYPYAQLDGFYAGAQKNLGVAGLTVVGLSLEWLSQAQEDRHPNLPNILSYQAWIENQSMLNTPSGFAWWVAVLVLRWIESCGGLESIAKQNEKKANLLYGCIDGSDFYTNRVQSASRSVINIPFSTPDKGLDSQFVQQAEAQGLLGLKGHRAVGGLRASLYNAIDQSAVEVLVEFMREFERSHG